MTRNDFAGARVHQHRAVVDDDVSVGCDAAAIAKAEQQISQISDGAKKVESTKELTMAKDAMAANDLEKCKSHLGNAIKGMDAM